MKENGFMRKLRKSNSCSHILKCSQQIKYQKLLIKNVFRSDVYWTLAYRYIDPMKKSLDHHCVKCRNTGFFLVLIFPHSDWIRRDTKYLSVFSPNAGKYGPENAPSLDTFHRVHHFLFGVLRCISLIISRLTSRLSI